jgi:hypothetical protein
MPEVDAAKIAALNDLARRSFEGCRVVLTQGMYELDPLDMAYILDQVRNYRDFTPANDPYGEHDFGKISTWEFEAFWKFDYFDLDFTMYSPDPADETVTARVLTIMLAEEY